MLKTLIILPFKLVIKLYKWVVSPLLGPSCRYFPTCSDYAAQAVEQYGPVKGSVLAVKRICRCHPLGGSGVDPVPDVKERSYEP